MKINITFNLKNEEVLKMKKHLNKTSGIRYDEYRNLIKKIVKKGLANKGKLGAFDP